MTRGQTLRLSMLVCVALLVGGAVRGAAPEALAATTAVTWTVDHAARTITVTANVAFYVVPPAAVGYQQQRLQATVDRARAAIEKAWNGHFFKCYSLIVKVNARAASGPQGVRGNEVPVQFDPGVYPVEKASLKVDRSRSYVATTNGPDDYLSDSSQFTPLTGAAVDASEWSFEAPDGVYAHEFGHILGLSDNYVEGAWTLKKGAADDLMRVSGAPVSDATITKAVRRSGQVDDKSIKCPLRIDLQKSIIGLPGFAGGTIELHGCAPDYDPDSTDPDRPAQVTFHGTVDVSGDALSAVPYLGSAIANGSLDFQASWSSPSATVGIDVGGGELIEQSVRSSGSGPVSVTVEAHLSAGGDTLGLGNIMTIVPFKGPCE